MLKRATILLQRSKINLVNKNSCHCQIYHLTKFVKQSAIYRPNYIQFSRLSIFNFRLKITNIKYKYTLI
jgi:hypothetical protein